MKRFAKVEDEHRKAFSHSMDAPWTIHIVFGYLLPLIGICLYQFPLSGYNGNDSTESGDIDGR